jgi:hypothetical protein
VKLPISSVASDIAGAQAQVLQAAKVSIGIRLKGANLQALDDAIWKDRTVVRAWGMRRTMFLLPSEELALFVRGTAKRSEYGLYYVKGRVSSKQRLDKLLDDVAECLDQPRTRNEIAEVLKSRGYRLKAQAGGGWGTKRSVPFVDLAGLPLSVGFLLHLIGSREAICSGPIRGNESTYVRADRWLPHWRDMRRERAEEELLVKYLRAFGPATIQDYALWIGLYIRDLKDLWSRLADRIVQVEVDGWKAVMLQSDLSELQKARVDRPVVRLLPNFDTFLLAHKSHRNIVDAYNHKKVYRAQGWVSPVVLVDGMALGVWSYSQKKKQLEVKINAFSRLPSRVSLRVREEADELARFLGSPDVRTMVE